MRKKAELKLKLKAAVSKLERTYPFASAFAQEKKGITVTASTRDDSIIFEDPESGVVFSVFTGESFIEEAVSGLSEQNIESAISNLLKAAKNNKTTKVPSHIINPGDKISRNFCNEVKENPFAAGPETMLDKARENRRRIETLSSKITMVRVQLRCESSSELYVNRNRALFQELNYCDNFYFFTLSEAKKTASMFGVNSHKGGLEHAALNPAKAKRMVRDGEKILNAERIKPGTYDCIFAPEVAGIFAHESFGHGIETDMFLKQRARGADFIGKQVAAQCVNMWDSPGEENPEASASFFFDAEGVLAKPTQIIKNGVLVSGLTDLNSSLKLGLARTPNGRRQSYSHKVYARMTNTFFQKGGNTLEEMIASTKYGFFIDHPTGGMEDPKGWGMEITAMYAGEIKDGRLTGKVFSPVIITGYVPDLLKSVSMLSDKLHFLGSNCGKGHKESVRVSVGGPAVKLKATLA